MKLISCYSMKIHQIAHDQSTVYKFISRPFLFSSPRHRTHRNLDINPPSRDLVLGNFFDFGNLGINPLNMPSSLAGMSDPEDVQNWSDMNVLEISSQQSYQGLPSFILETMSDYSVPSPVMLSDELRAYEDEFQEDLALLSESPRSVRAACLQASSNKQKNRIEEAELDIAAYNQHQTVAENTNGALADRLAGITTAHVLVCLERDDLRRFRMIAIYVIVVLVMLLLGFLVYVHRILHP